MKTSSKVVPVLKWILVVVCFFSLLTIIKDFLAISELNPLTTKEKVFNVVGIFLSKFIVLGVHELGLLVTGLVHGFRFDLFVVGPLGLKRENDTIKLYFNKNIGFYREVAGTSPKETYPDNAQKFAQVLLAGPITSLLFGLLCFLLVIPLGKPSGITVFTGEAISLGIFIDTMILSKAGMFFTDKNATRDW
jgi:hypothetical protein